MHKKAAVFSSRLTGIISLGLTFYLWKAAGIAGLLGGLISTGFWFAWSWFLQRK